MLLLGILNMMMLLFYLANMRNASIFLGGVIWSSFSYIYERIIWTNFFSEYLRDRVASGFLVLMVMIATYVCIYSKFGVACIICPTLECLAYQMWTTNKYKAYKNRTSNNLKTLLLFAILSVVVIFATIS